MRRAAKSAQTLIRRTSGGRALTQLPLFGFWAQPGPCFMFTPKTRALTRTMPASTAHWIPNLTATCWAVPGLSAPSATGHALTWWRDFVSNLRMIGYDDVLSIEHEDSLMSTREGLAQSHGNPESFVIAEPPGEMFWAKD